MSDIKRSIAPLLLSLCLAQGVACSGSDGENNGSSQPPTSQQDMNPTTSPDMGGAMPAPRNGKTDCGSNSGSLVQCSAGQYCAQEELSRCELGCLSDDNCTATQQCIKPSGQNEGSCQMMVVTPPDPCDGVTCNAGEVCRQGSCVSTSTPDPCDGVTCNAGEVCQQGTCVKTSTPSSCTPTLTAQDGCMSDAICVPVSETMTSCMSFPACGANQACAVGTDGAVCSTEVIPGKDPQCLVGGCVSDAHCPSQTFCVKLAGEPIGYCSDGLVGDECVDAQDCANALVCDRDADVEVSGFCEKAASAGCQSDADCGGTSPFCVKQPGAAGGACSEGRVADECWEEGDCIEALTCDLFIPGEPGGCIEGF